MDSVQVKDKNFQIYIQEEKIISRVSEVAAQISRDLADKKPLFLAVLNGSSECLPILAPSQRVR